MTQTPTTNVHEADTVKQAHAAKSEPTRPVGVFDYHRAKDTHGFEYVRVWEGSHLLDIVEIAFRQASVSAGQAERAETEDACRVLIEDALRCIATGEHYARMLLDNLCGAEPLLRREPAF
jgi:2-C-methyl-D-erythritol 4-phosphate cytidylyltransferase